MLEAVKRYARKVLLFHLVLLGVVVLVVLGAARSVYRSARSQAIRESSEHLDTLAEQTSVGIESYYVSIMSDLEAFLLDESDPTVTQPAPPVQVRGRLGLPFRQWLESRPALVDQRAMGLMWRQLKGRVENLFVVDNETGRLVGHYPEQSQAFGEALARVHLDWFRGLKETSMSHLYKAPEGSAIGDYHIIAVPAMAATGLRPVDVVPGGEPAQPGAVRLMPVLKPRTVVAVVPVSEIKSRFFDSLNEKGVVNAALVDDAGTVLVSENPKFIGGNVLSQFSPAARKEMESLLHGDDKGARVINKSAVLGGDGSSSRIVVFEPIKDLPGRRWTVLASAPVSDAEGLVQDLFKEAMFWAIFLSISVTGILASTSYFMIRSRVRYERSRHDMLAKEMEQARQIQLAWLPDSQNVPAGLEVSAANLPASHISGDFYNWFDLPAPSYSKRTADPADVSGAEVPSKVAIVIGDVTGHGMAAAFLMATTQLLVRTTLARYQDPGRCLQEVNRQLCTQGFRGQFVTMLVIVLDPRSSSIEIATAGHPSPLVERGGGNGKFVSLEMEPQLVLGVDANETYKTEGFILEPGASIMLYTDGVVEAEAGNGEQYGLQRLCAALSSVKGQPESDPQSRIQAVLEDVKRFCAEKELADDVTLVAVRTMAAAVQVSAEIGA